MRFDHKPEELIGAIAKALDISPDKILSHNVIKRALDCRHTNNIKAVYTLDIQVENESEVLLRSENNTRINASPCMTYTPPAAAKKLHYRPVIVGSGPCGLLAGLLLARSGYDPIILERGKAVEDRLADVNLFWRNGTLDPSSNVQFGEGGAGTFSDGKLTTQIKDRSCRSIRVIDELIAAGAPGEIRYQAKPHIGTDKLISILKNIRQTITNLGGEIRFSSQLTGIQTDKRRITHAQINDSELLRTDHIILAPGHSARDTFSMLLKLGLTMEAKPFSLGVRIEHPQSMIDKWQYGNYAGHKALGAAEYKLVAHCGQGQSVYSFCMCPGGRVIGSSSEIGGLVTNGMSVYARNSENANSALLVGIGPETFGSEPLAGMYFQREWEKKAFVTGGSNYHAPVQLAGDLIAGRASKNLGEINPSYTPGITLCDLRECLPEFIASALQQALPQFDKKIKGFARPDAVLTALESRSSSPVRIIRDEFCQSPDLKGLFPAGEGAGYAGGIMSAAMDGLRTAEALISSVNQSNN